MPIDVCDQHNFGTMAMDFAGSQPRAALVRNEESTTPAFRICKLKGPRRGLRLDFVCLNIECRENVYVMYN
jgi:cell fate regulator YaaT (PSP1 superfamily)